MFAIVINDEGYKVEFVVCQKNTIQEYNLKENEKIIEKDWNVANAMLKPQWNGTEWVETATEEELNLAYPIIVVQPTADEILRAKLIKDNADMQLQLAQQQKFNADLLLKIASLGGSANV